MPHNNDNNSVMLMEIQLFCATVRDSTQNNIMMWRNKADSDTVTASSTWKLVSQCSLEVADDLWRLFYSPLDRLR